MEKSKALARYEAAAAFLPGRLRYPALNLGTRQKEEAEEFRLRSGQPLTVLLPQSELPLDAIIKPEDLEIVCDLASEFSRYAAVETLRQGFLTAKGGFRIGFCGTAVMKDGQSTNMKDFSSAVIRIARERRGAADGLPEELFEDGRFQSTLILSPPGGGKTTLLRDLVRQLSSGAAGKRPQRIALIDERGEVAAMLRGQAQLEVGPHTDVLDGCPKALAIPMALRAVNPQIIAVDEITAREDVRAMMLAAGCGVALLATVHAADCEEMLQRPLYRELLREQVFTRYIRILHSRGKRACTVERLPC